MKLFKYSEFLGKDSINENLDRAKKFLKDRYIIDKAAKELDLITGDISNQFTDGERRSLSLSDFTPEQQNELKNKIRTYKLTDEQIRRIESESDFIKIREMLKDNPGYMYPFTYFFYVEMVKLDELESTYKKILEYKDLLVRLPKKFDANFIDVNIKNNFEVLVDGIDGLEDYKKVKKIFDRLTPELKKDYNSASQVVKGQFAEVSRAFDLLGEKDGVVDTEERERLQKAFFGEFKMVEGTKRYVGQLKRYKNVREFIKAAQNNLKASQNSDIIAFYDKINKCNEKFGNLGTDIEFDESGILIIEVKSFQANQMLNGHTRHCIKDYINQWQNYVSNHNNKQYYIYNFNIGQYDNLSVIGVTIEPKSQIRAAHAKDDADVSRTLKSTLLKWAKEYEIEVDLFNDVLKPMSDEEINTRERAKISNREIVKKGISKEEIIRLVKEESADINKDSGAALENAVIEDDIEKVRVILSFGASPNLKSKSESVISKAKTLDMIKILVDHGSELTGDVFNSISEDIDAVRYCLDAGLDPNFDRSMPLRKCCKGTYKSDYQNGGKIDIGIGFTDIFKLLIERGATITSRGRNMCVKWAAEYARMDILKFLVDELEVRNGFSEAIDWINHSRKLPEDLRQNVEDYLKDKIKLYGDK